IRALAAVEDFNEPEREGRKRDYFTRDMHDIFYGIALKPPRLDISSPLKCTLIQFIRETYYVFATIVRDIGMYQRGYHLGLYRKWSKAFSENMRDNPCAYKDPHTPVSSDTPVFKLADYVKGTPLYPFLMHPVSLDWHDEKRFEHTMIIGSAGSGKTTLMS